MLVSPQPRHSAHSQELTCAGLAPAEMRTVSAGASIEIGKWRLTLIPSRHAPTPFSDGTVGERIDAPLAQPVRATAWREGAVWSLLLPALWTVFLIVPGVCVAARRLHDIGLSGWLYLVACIPYIGGIFMLVVACIPSQPYPNHYGLPPRRF